MDSRNVGSGNDIPGLHVLLHALLGAGLLDRAECVARVRDALGIAVLGDLVDELGGIGNGKLLLDLLLDLSLDLGAILRRGRCRKR